MFTTGALLLALLVLPGGASAGALDDTILALEQRLAAGVHQGDREALEALLAGDFVLRGRPDIPRETWIDNALTLCWGERFEIDAFSARSLGEAVVASFVYTSFQDPQTCEPALVRSLVTSLWVERAGAWRLVLRHAGPAGDPGDVALQFLATPPPPPVLQGTAELSLVATAGNQDTRTLGAAAETAYRPGPWSTDGRISLVRTETGIDDGAWAVVSRLRQSRAVARGLELFLRAEYRLDEFAGIDFRLTGDAGLGYEVLAAGPHSLKLDTGLGYLDERRRGADEVTSLIGSLAGQYRWRLSETSHLSSDGGFVFRFEEGRDWRASKTSSVTVGLSRRFSLKVSHALNFLNLPVPGFERLDQVVSAALVTSFQR